MKKKMHKYNMQHFGKGPEEGSDYEDACLKMINRGESLLVVPFFEKLLGDDYRWCIFMGMRRHEKETV